MLKEFDDLACIKPLVDWQALQEKFGVGGAGGGPSRPAWDTLVMFRAIMLGDALIERSRLTVHAVGPSHIQAVCGASERRSSTGSESDLEKSGSDKPVGADQ